MNEPSKLNVVERSFGATDADTATTVAYLEDAIKHAKDEHAVCCVVILLCADGSIRDGWSAAERTRPYTIIGALEAIKQRYIAKNIEQR